MASGGMGDVLTLVEEIEQSGPDNVVARASALISEIRQALDNA